MLDCSVEFPLGKRMERKLYASFDFHGNFFKQAFGLSSQQISLQAYHAS